MKVFLIRHGETYGNLTNMVQGWSEVTLTEKGFEQARRAREVFSKVKIDRIISSDLIRTRQTEHEIFGDATFELDERLREINNTMLAGIPVDDLIAKYGDEFVRARRYLDYGFCGAETADHIMERTRAFLDDLTKDKTSERVAVVTHGGTIRAFIANVIGGRPDLRSVEIANCSVTELRYTEGKGWTLLHINNIKEL